MISPQDKGIEFEIEFSKRLGLSRVPGSGSQWHSKLDVHGKGARWSLKHTTKTSFTITPTLIQEAREATSGIGGTNELPMWAICIESLGTFVLMSEDVFTALAKGEISLLPGSVSKADERKARAAIPQLLRDE